jgi:hypothetical protein
MATSWSPDGAGNYILQFGTTGDDYWFGWGITQDRTLTFTIRDVGIITRFDLTSAFFDDWILVQVNGTNVYVGPYGGDRLQVNSTPYQDMGYGAQCDFDSVLWWWSCNDQNQIDLGRFYGKNGCYLSNDRYYCKSTNVQYGANSFGSPDLYTRWNISPKIDLRPYLVNGTNTIFVRVIVGGGGEGAIQMTTRQCPL